MANNVTLATFGVEIVTFWVTLFRQNVASLAGNVFFIVIFLL